MVPRNRKPVEPEEIVGQRKLRALLARAKALPGQPGANVTIIGPGGPDDIVGHTSMGNIRLSGVPHIAKPKPTGSGRVVKYKTRLSEEQDIRQRRSDER